MASLADIGQNRYKPNPQTSDRVHDGIVACVDDYVRLRPVPHAARHIILAIGFDLDSEALRSSDESHRLIDLGEPRFGIDRSLRHAPTDAFDFGVKNAPGKSVEYKLYWSARFDMLQAVFAKVGVDPDVGSIDESESGVPDINKLAVGKLQVGDDAIGGSDDRSSN